jgi:hypothetical protein
MAQLRTAEEFTAFITSDLTWRIREISDIRSIAGAAVQGLSRAILRASVPLMYAHWEGHVSVVSRAYMEFLALRRLRYSSLKQGFRLNAFFATIRRMTQTRLRHVDQIAFLRNVINSGESQLRNVDEDVLTTASNLNSAVLQDLCCFLSLDITLFEDDLDFLDKILLSRRNYIAHGQFIDIDLSMLRDMSDRVIEMMRKFNNLVDNEVSLQGYRA